MAEMEQVGLNLVISAENMAQGALNELRSTLESLVSTINKTFEEISGSAKMFDPIMTAGAETVRSVEGDFLKLAQTIETDMMQASQSASRALVPIGETGLTVARQLESDFRSAGNVIDAEFTTVSTTMERDFQRSTSSIKDALLQLRNTMKEAFGGKNSFFDSAELMIAGQMLEDFSRRMLGFFAESVHAAADFDQNIHNVVASLDAMGDHTMKPQQAFEALKQKALELGMSGFFSANQIAEAMNTMAAQGIKSQQILGGAIETVANVAAANQQDLEHTAGVVSDIIHQMGDELKHEFGDNFRAQMQGVGDAMTKALHNGRLSMEDFLTTMKYAGPQAATLGVSFKDLAGSIAELARHGIRGSQAGTTLRRMFTNLIPTTKAAKKEFEDLGFTTEKGGNIFLDAAGKMKPMAEVQQILHDHIAKLPPAMQQMAIKTIFGQYALSGMTAIVQESPSKFSALINSMGQTGVTAEALKEKSQGLGFQIQQVQAHFDTFKKEVGDALKPLVTSLLSALNSLFAAWQRIPSGVRNAIITFTAVSATIVTVVGGFMVFISTLRMFASSMGPLLSGIRLLFTNFTLIRTAIAALTGPWGLLITAIVTGVVLIITHWNQIAAWVKQNFGITLPTTMKQWQNVFSTVWNAIKKVVQDVWNYIGPTIINGIKEVEKFWKQIWPELSQVFQAVWTLIKAILAPIVAWMVAQITFTLGEIKSVWKDSWNMVKDELKMVWDVMKGVVSVAWDLISGYVKVGLDILTGHWGQAWKDMKSTLSNTWNDIKSTILSFINDAASWGSNLIHMLAHGIENAIPSLENAASRAAATIKNFLGFSSPTKLGPASTSDRWAPNFMKMFASGIEDNKELVENAVTHTAQLLQDGLALPKTKTATLAQPVLNQEKAIIDTVKPIISEYDRIAGHTTNIPSTTTEYDRIAGHTTNIPSTTTLYDRIGDHTSNQPVVHIHIEGRSAQTDQQLVNMIADHLGRKFRTHLTVATPR